MRVYQARSALEKIDLTRFPVCWTDVDTLGSMLVRIGWVERCRSNHLRTFGPQVAEPAVLSTTWSRFTVQQLAERKQ